MTVLDSRPELEQQQGLLSLMAGSQRLQRQCACGAPSAEGSTCAACEVKAAGAGSQMLQKHLAIGAADDPLEREADRVADQVMAGPAHSAVSGVPPRIHRFSRQGGGQMDRAPASVERVLARSGSPLESALRHDMEQRFGYDFSGVRVHTGADATQSARDVNANAYAIGNRIVFGAGQFTPGTHQGRHLIAHELTHVVQQSGADEILRNHGDGGANLPSTHQPSTGKPVIQRDTAGGGSTEFQDQVSVLSRPTHGPGIIEGTVTRTETAPASGSQPRQEINRGEMRITFNPNPSDCSITIPFGYNFVQAAQAGNTGICDEPPATTAVPPLPSDAFNRLKASVLAQVNSGLSGWFDIQLSGSNCPHGCANRALPIRINAHEDTAHPGQTITVVNRGGRADEATICAASREPSTAVHEGGHQVLGVGDEYEETDERLRATVPQWFRPERVRRDYSMMHDHRTRFAMFHERHFNGVKVFLERAFPGCTATLQARSRPIIPDYRIVLGGGYASVSGVRGSFLGAGLRLGIPLDRLRRWELVLGPQLTYLNASGNQYFQNAFLLGARLGLEGSTGDAGHGFTAGPFGEVGLGWFRSTDVAPGGAGSRSATAAYGELGLGAGYRTPSINSLRFDFRIEGAAGTAIGAPGIIGPSTRDIESDPARSRWFRLGLSVGAQF